MSSRAPAAAISADRDAKWFHARSIERALRLWSGVILMVFVSSHLLNHALGIFGVAVMSEAQLWRTAVWRSWPGSIVLIGAAATHASLALWRAANRRTWRMPPLEAIQIALGLLIPYLLVGHIVGTRVASSWAGLPDNYPIILRRLWPDYAQMQTLAVLVVWGHGVIGLYYAMHVRRWFAPLRIPLAILAALVPALALAGFVAASREAALLTLAPESWTQAQYDVQVSAFTNGRRAIAGVLVVAAAYVAFRLIRARLGVRIAVRYLGHGEVTTAPGATLLEISRTHAIPHPSTCGGRGRCSSCRVLVLQGQESLPQPTGLEQRMLERIRAPRNVRLACQIRPTADLNVRVLLASHALPPGPEQGGEALSWGVEEELTILFADIRGFAALAQNQQPADLIALLSRVIGEMGQAVEARGGRITMVQTDGIAAVFGMGGKTKAGSRAALDAAADILKAIHLVNKDLRAGLPLPIRVGIGIHSGAVVLSTAEDKYGGQRMVVIGEAVVVASRLEEATKELAADCVVSQRTIELAGFPNPPDGGRQVHYKNGAAPVVAHAFGDRQELRALLGRKRSEQSTSRPGGSEPGQPARETV